MMESHRLSRREARLMIGDHTLDSDELDTPIRGIIPKNLKTRADVIVEAAYNLKLESL
jgi:hypothetical protein